MRLARDRRARLRHAAATAAAMALLVALPACAGQPSVPLAKPAAAATTAAAAEAEATAKKPPRPLYKPPLPRPMHVGTASWYAPSLAGKPTASGEPYRPNALTAAHRTLPFGTKVRVTNLSNGLQVVVRINDRGPFSPSRIIDLSEAAAKAVRLRNAGVERVRLEILE